MPKTGKTPQVCEHGVLGVAKCAACKRAVVNRHAEKHRLKVNAAAREHQKKVRSMPEGRERLNRYMRIWNAGGVREEVIERYLVDSIKSRGGMCMKFISPGRHGAPDRIVCLPGKSAVFVEVKRPRCGKLGKHQERYHNDLRAVGQLVFVLWTKQDVDALLLEVELTC